jgi:hypothetical protein
VCSSFIYDAQFLQVNFQINEAHILVIFLLMYFPHGTGNLAELFQNLGISGVGV